MIPADLGVPSLVLLGAISAAAGVGAMIAFLHWTDRDAVRRCANQMIALVMEQALFIEDPVLVFRAQRELARQNVRLLGLLWRPMLICSVAFAAIYPHLDALFGHAALRAGDAAVITMQCVGTAACSGFGIKAPEQIAIETEGVEVPQENQVSWRIRPLAPVSGDIEIVPPGGAPIAKSIAAGGGMHYISRLRTGSWMRFLLDPVELRIASSQASFIAITYPPASILHLHWMIWFFAVSSAGAMVMYLAVPAISRSARLRRGGSVAASSDVLR